MAERYTLFEIEKLRDRFSLTHGVPSGVKRNYNISPTQLGSVVVKRDGVNTLERMKWGFIPATAKDSNSVFRYKTYLAKFEGIFSKPTWQEAITHRRCIVPANGYYEWQKTVDGKLPFYISPDDQGLFGFAGIYSSWTDPQGVQFGTFALVTTIHDRSPKAPLQRPVILTPDNEAEWLDPIMNDINPIYNLIRPIPEEALKIHRVAADVKNVKLNDPRLILPVKP